MKTKLRIIDFVPFTIMMLFATVGLYFALIVYRAYEPIAKGITGITLLTLEYRAYFLSPERNANEPTRLLFEYPTGFKYLGLGVFWAVVNYWAFGQIIEMIRYLIKLLNN